MIIIIVGQNRVEYCNIRKSDQEKKLFASRQQLYKVVPEGLVRMRRRDENGVELESEEVIIYREGSAVPYDTIRDVSYYQEDVLPEIDMIRGALGHGLFNNKAKLLMKAKSAMDNYILPYIGVVIVGVILAYAFLTGGS